MFEPERLDKRGQQGKRKVSGRGPNEALSQHVPQGYEVDQAERKIRLDAFLGRAKPTNVGDALLAGVTSAVLAPRPSRSQPGQS